LPPHTKITKCLHCEKESIEGIKQKENPKKPNILYTPYIRDRIILPGQILNAPKLPHHISEITAWLVGYQTLHILPCKKLQELLLSLTINFLLDSSSRIMYLNCTIRKYMSNNKRNHLAEPILGKECSFKSYKSTFILGAKSFLRIIISRINFDLRQSSTLIDLSSILL